MEHKLDKTNFSQDFFSKVEPIKMIDPLASTLGVVAENDSIEYHYSEVVKYAGHSCLAVSGAFTITKLALKELYGNATPIRGEIKVKFKGNQELNVNGPISQVVTFITGAAGNTGFKGLGGKYNRFKLLSFDENNLPEKGVTAHIEYERIDNGKKVEVAYRPMKIPKDIAMGELMPLVLSNKATDEEKIRFGNLWQDSVKIVLTSPPEGTFEITNLN
jgi:hypothetical protein